MASSIARRLLQRRAHESSKSFRSQGRSDVEIFKERLAAAMFDAITEGQRAVAADFAVDLEQQDESFRESWLQHVEYRSLGAGRERVTIFDMKCARQVEHDIGIDAFCSADARQAIIPTHCFIPCR